MSGRLRAGFSFFKIEDTPVRSKAGENLACSIGRPAARFAHRI